jgi:hypothetical protein
VTEVPILHILGFLKASASKDTRCFTVETLDWLSAGGWMQCSGDLTSSPAALEYTDEQLRLFGNIVVEVYFVILLEIVTQQDDTELRGEQQWGLIVGGAVDDAVVLSEWRMFGKTLQSEYERNREIFCNKGLLEFVPLLRCNRECSKFEPGEERCKNCKGGTLVTAAEDHKNEGKLERTMSEDEGICRELILSGETPAVWDGK